MRNSLPKQIRDVECGIVNLDSKRGEGTHWTAYTKHHRNIDYFDSYGNLRPPAELVKYFYSDGGSNKIFYNYKTVQHPHSSDCGHLCLLFLYNAQKTLPSISR